MKQALVFGVAAVALLSVLAFASGASMNSEFPGGEMHGFGGGMMHRQMMDGSSSVRHGERMGNISIDDMRDMHRLMHGEELPEDMAAHCAAMMG